MTERKPQQDRSRKAIEYVLEAGMNLLEQGGTQAISIRAIEAKSGVSASTIYRFFGDKERMVERIYVAILERLWSRVRSLPNDIATSRDALREFVRTCANAERELHDLDPEYYRSKALVLSLCSRNINETEASRVKIKKVFATMRANGDEIAVRDEDHAAFMMHTGLPSLIRGVITQQPDCFSREGFLEEYVDLVWSYLTAPRGA